GGCVRRGGREARGRELTGGDSEARARVRRGRGLALAGPGPRMAVQRGASGLPDGRGGSAPPLPVPRHALREGDRAEELRRAEGRAGPRAAGGSADAHPGEVGISKKTLQTFPWPRYTREGQLPNTH